MTDKEFLSWLASRLVNHYGENPDFDFVVRLRKMASADSYSVSEHAFEHSEHLYGTDNVRG